MKEERIEPIRPQLPQWEVERRNELFKNWGHYQCIGWRGGQPSLLLTANWKIAALLLVEMMATWKLLTVAHALLVVVHLVLACSALTCVLIFMRKDPGISSSCLPVANEYKLLTAADYCRSCRVYCEDGISHCPQCNCCIKDVLFHSELLERCITASNYLQWSATLGFAVSSLLYVCHVILLYRFT